MRISCWQLFAGHVTGSRPMEWKKKVHLLIIEIVELGCTSHTTQGNVRFSHEASMVARLCLDYL